MDAAGVGVAVLGVGFGWSSWDQQVVDGLEMQRRQRRLEQQAMEVRKAQLASLQRLTSPQAARLAPPWHQHQQRP